MGLCMGVCFGVLFVVCVFWTTGSPTYFVFYCNTFIIHSYMAHCTALTTNARTLQMPKPRTKTPAPSVRYACFAISIELSRFLCVSSACSSNPRRSLGLLVRGACSICVCTLVLIISNGKMDVQLTTPAKPPHMSTLNAVCCSESSGELQACLESS